MDLVDEIPESTLELVTICVDIGYRNLCILINEIKSVFLFDFLSINNFYLNLYSNLKQLVTIYVPQNADVTLIVESQVCLKNMHMEYFLYGVFVSLLSPHLKQSTERKMKSDLNVMNEGLNIHKYDVPQTQTFSLNFKSLQSSTERTKEQSTMNFSQNFRIKIVASNVKKSIAKKHFNWTYEKVNSYKKFQKLTNSNTFFFDFDKSFKIFKNFNLTTSKLSKYDDIVDTFLLSKLKEGL